MKAKVRLEVFPTEARAQSYAAEMKFEGYNSTFERVTQAIVWDAKATTGTSDKILDQEMWLVTSWK